MISRLFTTLIVAVCAGLTLVSYSAPAQNTTPPTAANAEPPNADASLAGTAWQLVEIVSMNDRVDTPADRSLYTVEFKADNALQVNADCNRGIGTWTSMSPGQLQLGQIAVTQAQCSPESLHDRYLAQLPRVRSYVMKGGHLFLATMADGSIIEFEPMDIPLVATVLGEAVRTNDADEMQQILLTRLFDRYAKEQGIEVSDAELDTYVVKLRRGMRAKGLTAEDDLTPEEAVQAEQMHRDMGRAMIRQWKLNRALYQQYGGRIIFQQLGPEPLDAYRQFLEERQAAGDFTIHHQAFEDTFWRYFTTDSLHSFYEPGSPEEAQAFTIPPWQDAATGMPPAAQPMSEKNIPAAPVDGGPFNWVVRRVTGGLHLRAQPSTSAEILATYPSGSILDNLGCRHAENRTWCDVQPFGGGPRGYVAAKYLKPATGPDGSIPRGPETSSLRAGQGDYDATGKIPCAQQAGQPIMQCDFGVTRQGGGFATVVVTKPNGMKRAIFFRRGVPTSADTGEADGYGGFSHSKAVDVNIIRVGEERYEIPDAVINGG